MQEGTIKEHAVYRHYNGGRYTVLFTARDSTNARDGNLVVLYVSLTNGSIFCRDLAEFTETFKWPDGTTRSRFVLDDETASSTELAIVRS
jgi:hypothetical protein